MKHKTALKNSFFRNLATPYTLHVTRKGFTLIEIMIVVGIISVLFVAGVISYSQFLKSSRDATRKADIENIRGALEIYRSNNNEYPDNKNLLVGSYIGQWPTDPLSSSGYLYEYAVVCPGGICNNYTLGARLEGTSSCSSPSPALGGNCKTGTGALPCNYCVGPVGQK